MKCPLAREHGEHPRAIDYLTDVITWRREQDAGLDSIYIPQWMADMVKSEMGEEIKAIDGTTLIVIPNSGNVAITIGLMIENNQIPHKQKGR